MPPITSQQEEEFLVLIADNHIDCSVLEPQLDHHCLSVILIREANETSMLLKTRLFDLVMLDLGFINAVKAADCINSQTPLIAIMDSADNMEKSRTIMAGFDDYLIRPVTINKLKEIIDLWNIKNKCMSAFDYIEAVLNATQNNHSLTLTIFRKLFEEFPLQITAIKDALAHQEFKLAEEITHKLHGSASFCGLTDIQKSANLLESSLINKNLSVISPYFEMLQRGILNLISQQQSIMALLKNV
ncbi:MAG: Hpt domain-containing protein [Methylococcales bacterium]|nr:Hpt domain-containing protein [Methylococcales bacterium]